MTSHPTAIPKWILILSGLFALMELFVGISLFVAPETTMDSVDMSGKGVATVVSMWAVRQFALGCILAFSVFKKSAAMLQLSWIFLLIMFAGDLITGLMQSDTAMSGASAVMSLVAAGLLFAIHRNQTSGN